MGNTNEKISDEYNIKKLGGNPIPSVMFELYNLIVSKKHTCAKIKMDGVYPKLKWCQSYPCANITYSNIDNQKQKIIKKQEIQLKHYHNCIERNEDTYPMVLNWCRGEMCCIPHNNYNENNNGPQLMEQMKQILEFYHKHNCVIIKKEGDKYLFDWCQHHNCTVTNNNSVNQPITINLFENFENKFNETPAKYIQIEENKHSVNEHKNNEQKDELNDSLQREKSNDYVKRESFEMEISFQDYLSMTDKS
jgi:hypothetical protein